MIVYVFFFCELFEQDNNICKNLMFVDYQKLCLVFDCKYGIVIVVNSMLLMDGVVVVILMIELWVKELGLRLLGYLCSYVFIVIDVWQDMLLGFVWFMLLVLECVGLMLVDFMFIDMYEVFVVQMLVNFQCLVSDCFVCEVLGCLQVIGEVDESKFNVFGGFIVYGYFFVVIGVWMIIQMLYELW